MSLRNLFPIAVLCVSGLSLHAASTKEDALRAAGIAVPPPKAAEAPVKVGTPDMEPLMVKRGKLIFQDSFDKGTINTKNWNHYKGNWEADGDGIKAQELASDMHHPAMQHRLGKTGFKDVIVQASFKFDGGKWMGLSLDNKEHVARCMMTPTDFKIVKMSGIGGTTKGENVDQKKFKFETGKWYTMLWEIRGQEMFARINDETYIFGEMAGVETDKLGFELICGGEWCGWDEVRIWEAEENPKWATTKANLLALKKTPTKKP